MHRGLLVVAVAACAATAHAQGADVHWQAGTEVRYRTLTEWTETGARLLTERGPVARIEFSATLDRAQGPALMVRGALAQGRLDYEGQNQGGVPLLSTTRHSEWEAGLHWRPVAASGWGEIWFGADWLRQRRDIASTPVAGGLDETSTLVLPGVRWRSAGFSFPAVAALKFQLEAQWRTSARHRLSVDYLGAYDTSEFDAGRRDAAALRFMATSPGGWRWTLGLDSARQSASSSAILRSGGAPVGSVREPAIRIDDISLSVAREF